MAERVSSVEVKVKVSGSVWIVGTVTEAYGGLRGDPYDKYSWDFPSGWFATAEEAQQVAEGVARRKNDAAWSRFDEAQRAQVDGWDKAERTWAQQNEVLAREGLPGVPKPHVLSKSRGLVIGYDEWLKRQGRMAHCPAVRELDMGVVSGVQ